MAEGDIFLGLWQEKRGRCKIDEKSSVLQRPLLLGIIQCEKELKINVLKLDA